MDRFVTKRHKFPEPEINNNDAEASEELKKESDKRKFRVEWLQSFKWLREQDGSAFCIACSKQIFSHFGHLKAHEKTALHMQNVESKKKQIQLEAFFNAEQRNKQQQVKFAEMNLVMFCITHNLPFSLMDSLPGLLVECCPDSEIAKKVKCARTKAVHVMDCISKQASQQIFSVLRQKKFSLIVDETTDVSNTKSIVLVARYVDSTCNVLDRFIGLLELKKADAVSIFSTIKEFFDINCIPMKNIIGLATDGASVMSGEFGGLKALLSVEVDLFYMKCTCHSLHLCSSYACKLLPKNVEWLCRNIYNFFSHSPKRINDFKEFQEYCSVKPHKILGICQTRWLSLEAVILRIVEQWDCLKLYFISCTMEINGVKPAELANEMSFKMKAYFLFLSYILPIVNKLNKEFQSQSSRLPYLYSSIRTNYLLILSNFVKKEFIDDTIYINYKDTYYHLETPTVFIGIKSEMYIKNRLDDDELFEVKNKIRQFYIEFLDQLNLRFDFHRSDLKLLQTITPAKVLSSEDISIMPLILEFPNLAEGDFDIIATQWRLLRLSELNLSANVDIDTFWRKISMMKNALNENSFCELTKFIFNLLTLPHSSAAAERKFSSVSLIKTKLRNRLEICTINDIMLCKELINKNNDPHYVWSSKKDLKFNCNI